MCPQQPITLAKFFDEIQNSQNPLVKSSYKQKYDLSKKVSRLWVEDNLIKEIQRDIQNIYEIISTQVVKPKIPPECVFTGAQSNVKNIQQDLIDLYRLLFSVELSKSDLESPEPYTASDLVVMFNYLRKTYLCCQYIYQSLPDSVLNKETIKEPMEMLLIDAIRKQTALDYKEIKEKELIEHYGLSDLALKNLNKFTTEPFFAASQMLMLAKQYNQNNTMPFVTFNGAVLFGLTPSQIQEIESFDRKIKNLISAYGEEKFPQYITLEVGSGKTFLSELIAKVYGMEQHGCNADHPKDPIKKDPGIIYVDGVAIGCSLSNSKNFFSFLKPGLDSARCYPTINIRKLSLSDLACWEKGEHLPKLIQLQKELSEKGVLIVDEYPHMEEEHKEIIRRLFHKVGVVFISATPNLELLIEHSSNNRNKKDPQKRHDPIENANEPIHVLPIPDEVDLEEYVKDLTYEFKLPLFIIQGEAYYILFRNEKQEANLTRLQSNEKELLKQLTKKIDFQYNKLAIVTAKPKKISNPTDNLVEKTAKQTMEDPNGKKSIEELFQEIKNSIIKPRHCSFDDIKDLQEKETRFYASFSGENPSLFLLNETKSIIDILSDCVRNFSEPNEKQKKQKKQNIQIVLPELTPLELKGLILQIGAKIGAGKFDYILYTNEKNEIICANRHTGNQCAIPSSEDEIKDKGFLMLYHSGNSKGGDYGMISRKVDLHINLTAKDKSFSETKQELARFRRKKMNEMPNCKVVYCKYSPDENLTEKRYKEAGIIEQKKANILEAVDDWKNKILIGLNNSTWIQKEMEEVETCYSRLQELKQQQENFTDLNELIRINQEIREIEAKFKQAKEILQLKKDQVNELENKIIKLIENRSIEELHENSTNKLIEEIKEIIATSDVLTDSQKENSTSQIMKKELSKNINLFMHYIKRSSGCYSATKENYLGFSGSAINIYGLRLDKYLQENKALDLKKKIIYSNDLANLDKNCCLEFNEQRLNNLKLILKNVIEISQSKLNVSDNTSVDIIISQLEAVSLALKAIAELQNTEVNNFLQEPTRSDQVKFEDLQNQLLNNRTLLNKRSKDLNAKLITQLSKRIVPDHDNSKNRTNIVQDLSKAMTQIVNLCKLNASQKSDLIKNYVFCLNNKYPNLDTVWLPKIFDSILNRENPITCEDIELIAKQITQGQFAKILTNLQQKDEDGVDFIENNDGYKQGYEKKLKQQEVYKQGLKDKKHKLKIKLHLIKQEIKQKRIDRDDIVLTIKRNSIEIINKRITASIKFIDAHEESLKNEQATLDAKLKKLNELTSKIGETTLELQKQNNTSKNKKDGVDTSSVDLKVKLKKLEIQKADLKQDIMKQKETVKQVSTELDNLTTSKEKLNAAKKRLLEESLKNEKATLGAKLKKLNEFTRKIEKTKLELQKPNNTSENKKDGVDTSSVDPQVTLKKLEIQKVRLEEHIMKQEETVQKVSTELENSKNKLKILTTSKEKFDAAQKRLDDLNVKLTEMQTNFDSTKDELTTIEAELGRLAREKEELTNKQQRERIALDAKLLAERAKKELHFREEARGKKTIVRKVAPGQNPLVPRVKSPPKNPLKDLTLREIKEQDQLGSEKGLHFREEARGKKPLARTEAAPGKNPLVPRVKSPPKNPLKDLPRGNIRK